MESVTAARRFPRGRFTKSLARICERLDACSDLTFDYLTPSRESPLTRVRGPVPVQVNELLAFGSWARGAKQCGDLDLVVVVEVGWAALPDFVLPRETCASGSMVGYLPTFGEVRRRVIGSFPYVHPISLEHSARLAEEGLDMNVRALIPIWKSARAAFFDWRAALAGVSVCPAAGRFERRTDLRKETSSVRGSLG